MTYVEKNSIKSEVTLLDANCSLQKGTGSPDLSVLVFWFPEKPDLSINDVCVIES